MKSDFSSLTNASIDSSRIDWIKERYLELYKQLIDFAESFKVARADMCECLALANKQPNIETWRRIAIRTSFTSIELLCNQLNSITLRYIEVIGNRLNEADLCFLFGVTESAEITKPRVRFGKYYSNTLRVYAAAQGDEYQPDESSSEWQLFVKGIKIRNRITHPRKTKDFRVSLSDYNKAQRGYLWAILRFSEMRAKGMRRQVAAGIPSGTPEK
jgi:hypothetical protein